MKREEFQDLYAEHARPLYAFLVYRTRDSELAEDILADTFVRVLRTGWPFDRRKASEKTWVYSIALNLLRDHVRRIDAERRAIERVPADTPRRETNGEWTDGICDRERLADALQELSDDEREAIALRYGADLSMHDVARLTRVRFPTAEARVHRGLGKLRGELE
jgi:RNA polymerase sigma-70 factor (ECF subfamily)